MFSTLGSGSKAQQQPSQCRCNGGSFWLLIDGQNSQSCLTQVIWNNVSSKTLSLFKINFCIFACPQFKLFSKSSLDTCIMSYCAHMVHILGGKCCCSLQMWDYGHDSCLSVITNLRVMHVDYQWNWYVMDWLQPLHLQPLKHEWYR